MDNKEVATPIPTAISSPQYIEFYRPDSKSPTPSIQLNLELYRPDIAPPKPARPVKPWRHSRMVG